MLCGDDRRVCCPVGSFNIAKNAPEVRYLCYASRVRKKEMPTKLPRLALVIDPHVKAQMRYLAQKHKRSTSAEIVSACLEWIKNHPNEIQGMDQPLPTPEQQAQIDELTQAGARAAFAQIMYFNNDSNTNNV